MSDRKRDFTFRQLNSFVAVAREGSFALAAERLNISQPAVSDHIAALEQNLGHSLFVRRRGTTPKLTREGVEMLHRAESLLRTSLAMRGETRNAKGSKVSLRVSAGPRLREHYLKPLLPRFYADHPQVEVELVPALPMRDVPAALERGEIDLLLYTIGQIPDGMPDVRHVTDIPILFVGTPEIAGKVTRGEIEMDDLSFILPNNGAISELWLERLLGSTGILPRKPIRYIEYADVVQTLVETGVGVSILTHERVEPALVAGRLATFGPALPPMKRVLIRATGAPRAAEVLEAELIRALKTAPPPRA